MPYADVGDYKFHYNEYGDNSKQTIILLHAFTLDSRMWEADAGYFSNRYHVITPDFKGHGKSDAPLSGYTRDERVADIMRVVDKLGVDTFHLAGLSYGGTTALGIALEHPDRLTSLTLIGTSAAGYKLGTKISRIDQIAREKGIEAAKKKWIQTSLLWYTHEQSELKEFIKGMMEEHSGAVWNDPLRGCYPQLNDIDKVGSIDIPTMILVGDADKMFLPLSVKLQQLIPKSELSVIPDCGHLVNMEQPEKFRQIFLEFISNHNC